MKYNLMDVTSLCCFRLSQVYDCHGNNPLQYSVLSCRVKLTSFFLECTEDGADEFRSVDHLISASNFDVQFRIQFLANRNIFGLTALSQSVLTNQIELFSTLITSPSVPEEMIDDFWGYSVHLGPPKERKLNIGGKWLFVDEGTWAFEDKDNYVQPIPQRTELNDEPNGQFLSLKLCLWPESNDSTQDSFSDVCAQIHKQSHKWEPFRRTFADRMHSKQLG